MRLKLQPTTLFWKQQTGSGSTKNQIKQQVELMNSTVDSIKDIFNTLGEDNAEFVAFQKILAIASAT